jgi:hypothetical protein
LGVAVKGHYGYPVFLVGSLCCKDGTLCNECSRKELKYMTFKPGRPDLGKEHGLGKELKVLELLKQRLGTRMIRRNQSIMECIQEVT